MKQMRGQFHNIDIAQVRNVSESNFSQMAKQFHNVDVVDDRLSRVMMSNQIIQKLESSLQNPDASSDVLLCVDKLSTNKLICVCLADSKCLQYLYQHLRASDDTSIVFRTGIVLRVLFRIAETQPSVKSELANQLAKFFNALRVLSRNICDDELQTMWCARMVQPTIHFVDTLLQCEMSQQDLESCLHVIHGCYRLYWCHTGTLDKLVDFMITIFDTYDDDVNIYHTLNQINGLSQVMMSRFELMSTTQMIQELTKCVELDSYNPTDINELSRDGFSETWIGKLRLTNELCNPQDYHYLTSGLKLLDVMTSKNAELRKVIIEDKVINDFLNDIEFVNKDIAYTKSHLNSRQVRLLIQNMFVTTKRDNKLMPADLVTIIAEKIEDEHECFSKVKMSMMDFIVTMALHSRDYIQQIVWDLETIKSISISIRLDEREEGDLILKNGCDYLEQCLQTVTRLVGIAKENGRFDKNDDGLREMRKKVKLLKCGVKHKPESLLNTMKMCVDWL